ncbi:MAG TPA: CBS domain-containing protein [Roseiflexaceae bacterium]|nr:CBS domain-containing protein [Roseiflexaceae bacterium]
MKVRDIMTREVTVVTAAQPITDVAYLMRQLDIGSLPVVQDGQLVGIITDRDIAIRVVADGLDPHMETAERHMTRDPVVASPDWPVEQAAQLMAREQIRRLPVAEGGRLVGYLALGDLAMQNRDRQVGETLEEISRPDEMQGEKRVSGR